MSCAYADGLSSYENKGICGVPEVHDTREEIEDKVLQLTELITAAKKVVVHTGAGISTSAGIPDFRGPKGVWTLEQNGEKLSLGISFNDAVPTVTHMALVHLVQLGYVHHIVSQNVDGLHLKSGLPGNKLSELHGNMFLDKCNQCDRQFIRSAATETVGQKCSGADCPIPKRGGRPCRGKLHDTILDWENELPYQELEVSEKESQESNLNICLGTTLQILPSGKLPLLCKKNGGKLVICNLQPTKYDSHADLLIHDYVDAVMEKLMKKLGLKIPEYLPLEDPTKTQHGQEFMKRLRATRKCMKKESPESKRGTEFLVKDDSLQTNEDTFSSKKVKVEDVQVTTVT